MPIYHEEFDRRVTLATYTRFACSRGAGTRMSERARILLRMDTKIPPGLQRLITEQAGVVSRQQLLGAGVSKTVIDSKVRRGPWQPIYPGTYGAFRGAVSWEARLWAAVLYAGPGALLTHETAAEILGLTGRRCPVIKVTIEIVGGGSHFPLEFRYDRDVERAHGLPAAARQLKFVKPDGTKGFRDRCYERYGLIVEFDGGEFHQAEQRGKDRARDNESAATTGATLRYGWGDVTRSPCATAGQVYRALRKRGYTGGDPEQGRSGRPGRPLSLAGGASRLTAQAGGPSRAAAGTPSKTTGARAPQVKR